jgi:phosphoesterase RecJ-like protein
MNNAVFINEDKVAYIKIYKKDMERYGVAEDCTEGLTEKLRAIKSVEVAFIVKQISQSSSKISMRSEVADVSAVCAKFGGGGHKLAAGCLIKSSVEEATNKILEEVKNLNI